MTQGQKIQNLVPVLPFKDENSAPTDASPVFNTIDYTCVWDKSCDYHFELYSEPVNGLTDYSFHLFFSLPATGVSFEEGVKPKDYTDGLKPKSRFAHMPKKRETGSPRPGRVSHYVRMSPDSVEFSDFEIDQTFSLLNSRVIDLDHQDRKKFLNKSSTPFHRIFYKSWEDDWEREIIKSFIALSGQVEKFLNMLPTHDGMDKEIFHKEEPQRLSYPGRPDCSVEPHLVIEDQNAPLAVLQAKYPHISMDTDTTCFMDMFSRSVFECICARTPYGVITDYFQTMVFKLVVSDEEIEHLRSQSFRFERDGYLQNEAFKYVKAKYRVVQNTDTRYTMYSVLTAFISMANEELYDSGAREKTFQHMNDLGQVLLLPKQQAIEETNQLYYEERALGYGDKDDTPIDLCIGDFSYELIHGGSKCYSQVLKIGHGPFTALTQKTPDSSMQYVVKVSDPIAGNPARRNPWPFNAYPCEERSDMFENEVEKYETLKDLWVVCVPKKFTSGYCYLRNKENKILFGGSFLVLEYLGSGRFNSKGRAECESAKEALRAIHNQNVAHFEVKKRNMISRDGKVFLVDFASSRYIDQGETRHPDNDRAEKHGRDSTFMSGGSSEDFTCLTYAMSFGDEEE